MSIKQGNVGRKSWISVMLAILIAIFSVTIAFAVFYAISTDDGSVSEWVTGAGVPIIPIFQTSPDDGGVDDNMDIKNAWTARGDDDHLYFLMEFFGSNPLPSDNTAAVAIIDCDKDAVVDDPDDRLVAYIRTGSGYLGSDALYITSGDYATYTTAGGSEAENHALGQVYNNYVEWGVPLAELPLGGDAAHCQGDVDIRFETASINIIFGFPPTIQVTPVDEIPTFRGFNIPTAISLQSFQADGAMNGIGVALTAVFSLGLVLSTAVGIKYRRKTRK